MKRWAVAVGAALACVFFGDAASWAVPPVPSPAAGGSVPNAWTCVDRNGPSPYPTTSPTPVPVADAAPGVTSPSPAPTTVTVYGRLGQDCAATSYVGPGAVASVSVTVPPAPLELPPCPTPDTSTPGQSQTPAPSPSAVTLGRYGINCSLLTEQSAVQFYPQLLVGGVLVVISTAAFVIWQSRPRLMGLGRHR